MFRPKKANNLPIDKFPHGDLGGRGPARAMKPKAAIGSADASPSLIAVEDLMRWPHCLHGRGTEFEIESIDALPLLPTPFIFSA